MMIDRNQEIIISNETVESITINLLKCIEIQKAKGVSHKEEIGAAILKEYARGIRSISSKKATEDHKELNRIFYIMSFYDGIIHDLSVYIAELTKENQDYKLKYSNNKKKRKQANKRKGIFYYFKRIFRRRK